MKKSVYAITAVFLLLAAGCDTMAGPEPGPGADQNGKAAVSLAIAGTGGRTVLPAGAELKDVQAWWLWGGKTGESPAPLTELFADYANQILYLETGDWDFTLKGYQDPSGETLILGGTITGRKITLEGPNILDFVVGPFSEGEGHVKITIILPDGHGITQARFFKDGAELAPITPVENSIVYEETGHKAGNYYYSFRLYKGEDLYGVVSELVKVRLNLISEETYKLEQEDLNLRYVITYHLNYDEPEENMPFDYYRYTEIALLLLPPDRLGYTFEGWHNDQKLSGEPVEEILPTTSTGDRDFYAGWTPIAYTVEYNANGGEGAMKPSDHTYDAPQNLTANSFTKTGFDFKEWTTKPGGGGDAYIDEASVSNLSSLDGAAVPLYAQWTPIAYTVKYNANGGEGDMEPSDHIYGEEKSLTVNEFTRDGFNFGEWNTDPDGNGVAYGDKAYVLNLLSVNGVVNLYARWDPRAPITIALQAVPSDPQLRSVTVTIGDRNPPTFELDTAYTDYTWYWDGFPIEEATTASYTLLDYGQPGIYELFVMVTDEGGRKLSARCLVTIIKTVIAK
jgi:uncharacterized repeat protein (TIGR02543 family)